MDWTSRCSYPKGYTPSCRPRLLLTGSNGLLGQAILNAIAADADLPWEVIALSKGSARGPSRAVPYIALDITDTLDFAALVRLLEPSYVIHTAAMTDVDACETQKRTAYQHNVAPVEVLCDALPMDAFVLHLSTDFVFSGRAEAYEESDTRTPLNYYGRTKQQSEELLEQSKISWAVVRTSLVYGRGEALTRLPLLFWVKKSLEDGRQLRFVDDQWRMPTFVVDLAEACLTILRQRVAGIFHISGQEVFTPYNMMRHAAAQWGYEASLVQPTETATLGQRAPRPSRSILSLKKAIRVLNYQSHSFLEALRHI